MTGNLLLRGMLAGLLAGILAFGFAKVFGEPSVDQAIALEGTMEHSHVHAHVHGDGAADEEEELISREMQSTFGLLTGVVIYSVSMGGIFALVFAFAMGRMGGLKVGPRGLAAILAVLAFTCVILVPGLKYPANPPAVGDPETLRQRTKLFFLMLVVSLAALVVAINVFRKLLARYGGWTAAVWGIVLYGAIMAVAGRLFPSIDEVPAQFPAALLWDFRMASLGIHVVLWTVLGLAFGWLAQGPVLAPRNRHDARLQS